MGGRLRVWAVLLIVGVGVLAAPFLAIAQEGTSGTTVRAGLNGIPVSAEPGSGADGAPRLMGAFNCQAMKRLDRAAPDCVATPVNGAVLAGYFGIPVASTVGFAAGDEVILAGMNGATVDHHEFATIAVVFGNYLIFTNPVSQSYTAASVAAVAWTNLTGVSVVSDGLQNATCQQSWSCGAASSQAIASGDGYVEFTANDATNALIAGLGLGNANAGYDDVEHAFLLNGVNGAWIYESGANRGSVGKYGPGDTFRVGVEAGVVTYRHNGRVVYRSTVAAAYPLVFDTSFYSAGARIVSPRLATGANAAQVIRVPNYTTLGLGTKVRWAHAPAALDVDGNDLLAGTGCSGWACGATSDAFIQSGDGFVEFTTSENTKYKLVGLGKEGPVTSFSHAQFGLVLTDQGYVFQYLYGTATWPSALTTYVPGDVFRISIEDGAPLFRKNGAVIAGWNVGPDYPLRAVANFAQEGATVTSVTMVAPATASAPLAPGWSSVSTGLTTTATSVTAGDPCSPWACGAVSEAAILAGDGYVEFSTSETTLWKVAGLGDAGPIASFHQIAFGILLQPGGGLYVMERGEVRRVNGCCSFGYFAAGDVFRVGIEAGQVVYRQNGTEFYRSQLAPVYPFRFVADFHDGGATVNNVRIYSGGFSPTSTFGWAYVDSRVVATANSLTAGATCPYWACGAVSNTSIGGGNGYVEFSTNERLWKIAGLGDPGVTAWDQIAYGFLLGENGTVWIMERGVWRLVNGCCGYATYAPGDTFRIGVESGQVVYRHNGVALYTSQVPPPRSLHFAAAFHSLAGTLTNVSMSPMYTGALLPSDWSYASSGVRVTNNNLYARTCQYWECGVVSELSIPSGDGYAEFSTNEINRYKLAGLTNATLVDGWSDVSHGFMLNDGGGLYLWEQGVMVFNGGYYEAGDRFRVGVENGQVVYRRNGNLLYVSNTPPTYPLRFGADFYHAGATVTGVQMSLNGITGWAKSSPGVVMSPGLVMAGGACGEWACHVMSDVALQDGDGHVEFRAAETNRSKEAGLGAWSGTAPQVAFGLRLSDQGVVEVYENGVKVTAAPTGQYAVGDIFRIGVENGQVKYRKNGTLMYTSAGAPVYPARFIARMGASGATVSAARLASTATVTASLWDGLTGGAFAVRVSEALSADGSSIYLGNVRPLEQLSTNEVNNGSFEEGFAVVNDNDGAGSVGSFWSHTSTTTYKASFAQASRESGLQQHISGGLAGNGITQSVVLQLGQSYLLRAVITVQAGAAQLQISGQDGSGTRVLYACGPGPERLLSLIYQPTTAGEVSIVRVVGSQPNSRFFVDDVQLSPTTLTSVSPGGSTQACTTPIPSCVTGMSPGPNSFSKEGGWATFGVVAEPGCVWQQESSDSTWLIPVSGVGVGSSSVVYAASPNPTPWARTAKISIWGAGYDVTQAAGPCTTCPAWPAGPPPTEPPPSPPSCVTNVTPSGFTVGVSGGVAQLSVQAPASCSWSANESAAFLDVTSGASGTGNGTISVQVASNSAAGPRAATIEVGGISIVIQQLGTTELAIYGDSQISVDSNNALPLQTATTGDVTFVVTCEGVANYENGQPAPFRMWLLLGVEPQVGPRDFIGQGKIDVRTRATLQDRDLLCAWQARDVTAPGQLRLEYRRTVIRGYRPNAVTVKIAAFIPDEVFPNPSIWTIVGGDPDLYSIGDNRGFSYDGSARIMQLFTLLNPAINGPTMEGEVFRTTGATEEFAPDAIVPGSDPPRLKPEALDDWVLLDDSLRVKFGFATTEGMQCAQPVRLGQQYGQFTSSVRIRCVASVSHPFVALAPAIDWDYTIRLTFSQGAFEYEITGCHDGFPAHEMYLNGEPVLTDQRGWTPLQLAFPGCVTIAPRRGVMQ